MDPPIRIKEPSARTDKRQMTKKTYKDLGLPVVWTTEGNPTAKWTSEGFWTPKGKRLNGPPRYDVKKEDDLAIAHVDIMLSFSS